MRKERLQKTRLKAEEGSVKSPQRNEKFMFRRVTAKMGERKNNENSLNYLFSSFRFCESLLGRRCRFCRIKFLLISESLLVESPLFMFARSDGRFERERTK